MLLKIFLIYSITSVCSAKININIKMGTNKNETVIQCNGHDNKLVTDNEIKWFNITDENLKKGARIELGRFPDDIFLKDPTPYNDLFHKYKWQEIHRDLQVRNVKVLELFKEDVTLSTHEHINNTTETIKSKSIMFKDVENIAFSTWSKDGLPYDDIRYDVEINFDHGKLKYENKWRSNSLHNVVLPFGVERNGKIKIMSGQTVVTKLTASKIILLIKIEYKAQLIGNIIANFAHEYGKYHFWAPSIGSIMKAGAIKNEILSSEFIEIRGYTSPKLSVYDKTTGKTVRNSSDKTVHFRKKLKFKNKKL